MTEEKLEKLEWEEKLLRQGVPADEVQYRRYREAMLLRACAAVQNAYERIAIETAALLTGEASFPELAADKEELQNFRPEPGLETAKEEFLEELRHCMRFFDNPKATDTFKLEELAA